MKPTKNFSRTLALVIIAASVAACGGAGSGEPIRFVVPEGASFAQIADSLKAHEIIGAKPVFEVYARMKGVSGAIKPGTYAFRKGTAWDRILGDMKAGRVLTAKLIVPEGFDVFALAPRIATVTGLKPDSVLAVLTRNDAQTRFGVPGPTLDGYLYPATYDFPINARLDSVLHRLVAKYHHAWNAERKARADSMHMSERDAITLASIIEKEAKHYDEMPLMSSVYHNRLRIGMPLGADPTIQYALGEHRAHLSYAAIDSVKDNPYNTYRIKGLPPGPVGSPDERAMDAALNPATSDFLYFVAKPDGTHVFTKSLAEHNKAKAAIQRERAAAAAGAVK
jgi:UPF0755 protein